jgi:hypothetical protein
MEVNRRWVHSQFCEETPKLTYVINFWDGNSKRMNESNEAKDYGPSDEVKNWNVLSTFR